MAARLGAAPYCWGRRRCRGTAGGRGGGAIEGVVWTAPHALLFDLSSRPQLLLTPSVLGSLVCSPSACQSAASVRAGKNERTRRVWMSSVAGASRAPLCTLPLLPHVGCRAVVTRALARGRRRTFQDAEAHHANVHEVRRVGLCRADSIGGPVVHASVCTHARFLAGCEGRRNGRDADAEDSGYLSFATPHARRHAARHLRLAAATPCSVVCAARTLLNSRRTTLSLCIIASTPASMPSR
eukprot:361747-Chlamydomonas_euryale.AAC.11